MRVSREILPAFPSQIKTIGVAVLTAALITGQALACTPVPSNVLAPYWPKVGETLSNQRTSENFACPTTDLVGWANTSQYQNGAPTPAKLAAVGCYHLPPDTYEIIDARPFTTSAVHYRIVPVEFDASDKTGWTQERIDRDNAERARWREDHARWISLYHPIMRPVMVCQ